MSMLKYIVLMVGVFAFAKANSQQISATASSTVVLNQQPAVLVVEQFFEDFHKQDTLALRKHLVEGASLMSLSIRDGQRSTAQTDLDTFLKNIASIPDTASFKEGLTSIKAMESDDIASVHADYNFYYNGNQTHSGINVFTLVFIANQWKITQITDTRVY
jgi:hypothetical protein